MTKYYYVASNQIRFLQEEVIEEILRERANYYISKKKPIDFWLLISPEFLREKKMTEKIRKTRYYSQKMPLITWKGRYDFYAVVISTNKEFIKWLKLRIGYFEDVENPETEDFMIDGIYGSIDTEKDTIESPLKGRNKLIYPSLMINKYEMALEMYYSQYFPNPPYFPKR
jgi:hypothetical protein